MEQVTVSITNTAKALGVSRPTVYKLIRNGKLETFMIGSRRLTTPEAIRKCIQSCELDAFKQAHRIEPKGN